MKQIQMITVLLGAVFSLCGCSKDRLPADVTIDGLALGKATYAAAEDSIRARLRETVPTLIVRSDAGEYVFSYPEVDFHDNAYSLVRSVRRGGSYATTVQYYLKGIDEAIARICMDNAIAYEDAAVTFTAEGFFYTPEQEGRYCDAEEIKEDILASLEGSFAPVEVKSYPRPPVLTEEELRLRTQQISSYSTVLSSSENRTHNVKVACGKIDGTCLPPGGVFSFNRTVGKRTIENGYRESVVIQDGVYQKGVGGGVCQVSSTLYNGVLRAGLTVTSVSPHTLASSYVPPSLDAMVSDHSDLEFINEGKYPVYIRCVTKGNRVQVIVYGKPDGRRYEPESVVKRRIEPPEPEIRYGMQEKVIRAPHTGVESESYLNIYEGDKRIERRRIRKDKYATVQGILQKVPEID